MIEKSSAMDDDIDNPEWGEENTAPLDYAGKLKVTRARLRLSQAGLAALLQIPLSTLQNWERRRTVPDAPALTLIDLIYGDPEGIRARLGPKVA